MIDGESLLMVKVNPTPNNITSAAPLIRLFRKGSRIID